MDGLVGRFHLQSAWHLACCRTGIRTYHISNPMLVGGDWNMTVIFPYIGNVIIPIGFHIFQRGLFNHQPEKHLKTGWNDETMSLTRSLAGKFPHLFGHSRRTRCPLWAVGGRTPLKHSKMGKRIWRIWMDMRRKSTISQLVLVEIYELSYVWKFGSWSAR